MRVAAVAAGCLVSVLVPATQASAKSTFCTRNLGISTTAFTAALNLGTGTIANDYAKDTLTKSLRTYRSRLDRTVRIANATCTRDVRVARIARDAALRRARTTFDRVVARQKFAAQSADIQAEREAAVYRAFLNWETAADRAYGLYDSRVTTSSTATARATFRSRTATAAAILRSNLNTATTRYLVSRAAAKSRLRSDLAVARGLSDATARAKSVTSAWDTYVRALTAAQRAALASRASSIPVATTAIATAHAEYESEIDDLSGPTGPGSPETGEPTPTASPS